MPGGAERRSKGHPDCRGDPGMPAETLYAVIAVVGAFAFFGGLLLYSDLTWDRARTRR